MATPPSPLNLTNTLERMHFRRLGDLINEDRMPAIEVVVAAANLRNHHGPSTISEVSSSREKWVIVTDRSCIIWVVENDNLPIPYRGGLVSDFKLKFVPSRELPTLPPAA